MVGDEQSTTEYNIMNDIDEGENEKLHDAFKYVRLLVKVYRSNYFEFYNRHRPTRRCEKSLRSKIYKWWANRHFICRAPNSNESEVTLTHMTIVYIYMTICNLFIIFYCFL